MIILKLDANTWSSVLIKCKDLFDEEPALELALGPVIKDAIGKREKPPAKSLFLRWTLPFWFVLKNKFHLTGYLTLQKASKKTEDIITENPKGKKSFCVFGIDNTRENNFDLIFPVLKKIDEKNETSILFTYFDVYNEKKDELSTLKNTSIIFFENLLYKLNTFEIISKIGEANRLYNQFIKRVKDNEINDFVKQHKNEMIFRLEELLIFTESLSKILKNKKSKFIFSWGGYFPFALIGKKLKIRTLMIQHGCFGNVDNPSEFGAAPPECSPHAADEIIMWGEHSKIKVQKLFKYDSTRKIFNLGNPFYDAVIEKYKDKKRSKEFYEKLKIDPNKKNIVMFSQTHVVDSDQGGKFACRFINPIIALDKLYDRLNSKINLIIKLHPHETKKYYEKYLKNIDNVRIIKSELPLGEIFQYTDISLSVSCTTTLEAMIFEIPTLQLVLSEQGVRGECYFDYGAAIHIKNEDALIDTIEKIISNNYDLSDLKKNQKKFLEQNFANLGNATNKIVEHLLKDK